MRIVMMGTGTYAVPLLAELHRSVHDLVGVITRPEVEKIKDRAISPSPIRVFADREAVTIFAPDDINGQSAHSLLLRLQAELFIVCDFGQILSPETLSLASGGGLNLHASLLPKYRGAAPVQWAIYHGERHTGNSVIQMTAGVDAGPILAQQQTPIQTAETTVQLEARLAKLGSKLVMRTIDQMEQGTLQPFTQIKQAMTRAPKLQKKDGQIEWNRSAEAIVNQIRAMVPWPRSFTHYFQSDATPLRIIIESALVTSAAASCLPTSSRKPGQVLVAEDDRLLIQTGDGALAIEKIQPAGKRVLSTADFLRGYRVQMGDRFGSTPT